MLHLARKLAAKSQHKQHHHACIITKGGSIVAVGYNHKFMHAEMDAIRKVNTKFFRTHRVQKGLTLYSLRWRKGGGFGNAKPCSACMAALSDHRYSVVDAIYYTNDKGELTKYVP